MRKRWIGLAAALVVMATMAPTAQAVESDWAYWKHRAEERRYERALRRQERAQFLADQRYERAMRRAERRAYRVSQHQYWRTDRRAYRIY